LSDSHREPFPGMIPVEVVALSASCCLHFRRGAAEQQDAPTRSKNQFRHELCLLNQINRVLTHAYGSSNSTAINGTVFTVGLVPSLQSTEQGGNSTESNHMNTTEVKRQCALRTGRRTVLALGLAILLSAAAQAQRQATATATVAGGSITGISVTDGGAGYSTAPAVTIAGGGGSGATAKAEITREGVSRV